MRKRKEIDKSSFPTARMRIRIFSVLWDPIHLLVVCGLIVIVLTNVYISSQQFFGSQIDSEKSISLVGGGSPPQTPKVSRDLISSVSPPSPSDKKLRRVLIISVAPRSIKHVVALWSELECFTVDVDRVIISGPVWSQAILETMVEQAKKRIPRFSRTTSVASVSLESLVFVNNRYDVGLWCDALEYLHNDKVEALSSYDEIGLLNDSVFALREYTDILSALHEQNVSMTSLSYSLWGSYYEGYGPEYRWLESVWRGFDQTGIQTFREYSCRPSKDKLFCPDKKGRFKKACIIENFERAMSHQFPRDKTYGLFSSDTPKEWLDTKERHFQTWVQDEKYWQTLVQDGFPVSKVNWEAMIASIDDDRLQTCTGKMDRTVLNSLDFSKAKSRG